MRTFIFLCLIFVASFTKSKTLRKKTASSCASPVYIKNALDSQYLDLSNIPDCGVYQADAKVIMSHSLATWCYTSTTSTALTYNGLVGQKACAVGLYGDSSGDFEGIFAKAMMNTNWMLWQLKTIANGYTAIYSLGPGGTLTGNLVLTWDGTKFSLTAYSASNRGQKWLITKA